MYRFLTLIILLFSCAATAAPAGTTIDECWENRSHTEMSQCVLDRASAARVNLSAVENNIRTSIAKSHNDAKYLSKVKRNFEISIKSFQKYRQDQCTLHLALAAQSNGAPDIQKACEAELDVDRTEQLKASLSWLDI